MCKVELKKDKNLFCMNCNLKINCINDIARFETDMRLKENIKIKKLNEDVKSLGYENAIKKFTEKYPNVKNSLYNTRYDQSVDYIFHGITDNKTCIEIKSELGNRVEILANIFENVYSIDFDQESLEFQRQRFKEKKLSNIFLHSSDPTKLPFPDEFFDMILCNEILEEITDCYKEKHQNIENLFIKELTRILKPSGKIIFGINSTKNKKYDLHKIKQICSKNQLENKIFWVVPSYNKPYFSARIDDKKSLRWFINNINNFLGKKSLKIRKKFLLSVIQKTNFQIINKIIGKMISSHIVCCSKNGMNDTLENIILKNTGFTNIIMLSRRMKIFFLLFDEKNIPKKIVSIKRYGKKFPQELNVLERKFPNYKDPDEKMWIEDWFPGHEVNPLKKNEVTLVINWLKEFQNNSKQERFEKEDIEKEITLVKKGLEFVKSGKLERNHQWLEDYKNYMLTKTIHKTAAHGDFWVNNILINPKSEKINVLDWEYFKEKENPLFDFLVYYYDTMAMTQELGPVELFEESWKGKGESQGILELLKKEMESHLGFELDMKILLRFYILRKIIPKEDEMVGKTPDPNTRIESTIYVKMLDIMEK